jgi:hypothetical protein
VSFRLAMAGLAEKTINEIPDKNCANIDAR